MPSRRDIIKQVASVGVSSAVCSPVSGAGEAEFPPRIITGSSKSPRIKSALRLEETVIRYGGDGDNWYMSWASDDRQLIALCDGMGFAERPNQFYNTRLLAVRGGPQGARFEDVPGYPSKPHRDGDAARFYGFGTLAAGRYIYQFLSTFADSVLPKTEAPPFCFNGVKLIYSSDNGRTWFNQDGTTPVVWQSVSARSKESMLFFQESQDCFGMLSVLQMGRGYMDNRDGYVYVYGPNGSVDGTMNQLVMFRVKKDRLCDRAAYEYFSGQRVDGEASWSGDIQARAVVHTFPRGWVNTTIHPMAWSPSVVYNAPLGLYMMANWGMGSGSDLAAPNGNWFDKPSYLGFWTALQPWGPWTQVHEELAWKPGSDSNARAYSPVIAPKWISHDGKSFWLVWTDFQHADEFWPTIHKAGRAQEDAEFMRLLIAARALRPYYAFNAQRVDLEVV